MAQAPALDPVETPKVPVSNTYHGVTVTEDYRWLEDAGADQTRSWTMAQDQRTRSYLENLPGYGAVRRRVEEVLKSESVRYDAVARASSAYFALKHHPPKQQPFLVVLSSLDDVSDERVLVDPNEIDNSGSTTIDWYRPSPDGSLVAVSLSSHGTEDGTVHVYEATSGELTGVTVPRVNGGTAGGSLAWAGDSAGFWYTRYPSPDKRPEHDVDFYQEVWYHPLGNSLADDRRELSAVFADDRIAENFLSSSPDGLWVMDRVQKGDGGEWQVFVRAQRGADWWLVADLDDRVAHAAFGPGALYLLSRLDAPHGKVLRLPLEAEATVAQAVVVVPEAEVPIEGQAVTSPNAGGGLAVTDNRLWLVGIDAGLSSLRLFDLDGTPAGPAEVPANSSVYGLVRLDGLEVAYATESFTQPRSWWRASGQSPRRTALVTKTPLDFSGLEVRREFATSVDGTQVPVTLIMRPGLPHDGTMPALLTGYGGYGISLKPRFDPTSLLWLEQGGVLAIAHTRGGGEYGESWHHAGRLATKQNVFDDFAACARFLVDSQVTTTERLAMIGGSNGGLLMGAVLTQHPGISRAVVAMVPVLDVLRVELHPNGAFNVTEFGTVQDLELFRAMRAYSPYHNVEDGVAYPAVLLTAGEFDPRVDAYHAKKMAARLQAATSSGQPVLLRVEAGGHGLGSSLDQRVSELADVYAFLFDRLGIDYQLRSDDMLASH
ncbi:MAG TPA: prolyl oligopeptidase family serine peptidase [Actinomycetes bacterium]|nr:prolyl oligopeptidase family serine peptidase [Actinomycetes bacterium]